MVWYSGVLQEYLNLKFWSDLKPFLRLIHDFKVTGKEASPWSQDVNWTYIRDSERVQDVN